MEIQQMINKELLGEVTIVVRDVITNKVVRTHVQPNIIGLRGFLNLLSNTEISPNAATNNGHIYISGRRMGLNTPDLGFINILAFNTNSPSGPHIRTIPKTGGTPYFVEYLGRFDPTTFTRTIWAIGLTTTANSAIAATYAQLSVPCTQTTTEVLDVYYRIQILDPALTAENSAVQLPAEADAAWSEWIAGTTVGITGQTYATARPTEHNVRIAPSKIISPNKYYKSYVVRNAGNISATNGTNPNLWTILSVNADLGAPQQRYGIRRYTSALTINSEVGRQLGSVIHGIPETNTLPGMLGMYLLPWTPRGFQPVQPIHKHNAAAIAPFLDVNTLATGTGTVNATGTGWTEETFPEYFRININATGDVGTSRYTFMQRNICSFTGNTYACTPTEVLCMPSGYSTNSAPSVISSTTHYTKHHARPNAPLLSTNVGLVYNTAGYTERVNDYKVMWWDDIGIQVADLKNNIYRVFDSTSAPIMTATAIRQCASDDLGFIYVACANTGLWKIWAQEFNITAITPGVGGTIQVRGNATPFLTSGDTITIEGNTGTNAVNTTFTTTAVTFSLGFTTITISGSIPADATSSGFIQLNKIKNFLVADGVPAIQCYGVSKGFNNSVWALFNGGLSRTDNQGTTWTTYNPASTPNFNITGLTNGLWANVQLLRVQPDSPTFRMGFVVATSAAAFTGQVYWWSLQGSTALGATQTGPALSYPTTVTGVIGTGPAHGVGAPRLFDVSKTAGFWKSITATAAISRLDWATTSNTLFGRGTTGSLQEFPFADFIYDSYDTPYVHTVIDTTVNNISVFDSIGTNYGVTSSVALYPITTRMSPFLHLSRGMSIGFPVNLGSGVTGHNQSLGLLYQPDVGSTVSSLNRADTIGQEFLWDRWNWNTTTSAWEKEYHAMLPDTSGSAGGPFNGTRKNFPIENHTFTGRSIITVPTPALTSFFTNQFVLAVRETATAKLTFQDSRQTIASYIDLANPTNNWIFELHGSATANNIVLQYGNGSSATFGTTASPAIASTNNLVLVLNGSSASVFLNGAQVGTTQTLTAFTVDMAPATGRLIIGGRIIAPDSNIHKISERMFRGTMLNLLLDSSATSWTVGGNVASYQSTPLTFTTGTTRVRYELNQLFNGVAMLRETKPTHVGFESLINGIQNRFTSGVTSPATSFVSTENYTFGVYNGILKDNATSFTQTRNIYALPLTHEETSLTPAIVPSASTTVTEKVVWRNSDDVVNSYFVPGVMSHNITNTGAMSPSSFQSALGNCALNFTTAEFLAAPQIGTPLITNTVRMGIHDALVVGAGSSNVPKWGFDFLANGTVNIAENNVTVLTNVGTWNYNDVWTISRVGTTISFFKNSVLLRTSPLTSAARLWVQHGSYAQSSATVSMANFFNVTFTYDRPANFVAIGNSGTLTGVFDPDFFNIDATVPSSLNIKLNGTPVSSVTVAGLGTTIEALPAPAPGSCTLISDAGLLLFNAADVGKTVTGRFTVLFTKP